MAVAMVPIGTTQGGSSGKHCQAQCQEVELAKPDCVIPIPIIGKFVVQLPPIAIVFGGQVLIRLNGTPGKKAKGSKPRVPFPMNGVQVQFPPPPFDGVQSQMPSAPSWPSVPLNPRGP